MARSQSLTKSDDNGRGVGERGGRGRDKEKEGQGQRERRTKRKKVTQTMGVSDIFKLAPGPMEQNTGTLLGTWDDEPGKLT